MQRIETWSGSIPLSYRYTAGQAGEVFFTHLAKTGELLASRCKACKTKQLPPKIYCEACFGPSDDYVVVKNQGKVESFTQIRQEGQTKTLALVSFTGVKGGLMHWLEGTKQPRIGMKVKATFETAKKRKRTINDILCFKAIK